MQRYIAYVIDRYNSFGGTFFLILLDRDCRLFRNVGTSLSNCKVSHSRRL